MNCLKAKYVTIRKEHKCFGCLRKFPPKTRLYYTAGACSDGFWSSYWCDICHEELKTWPEWFDEGVEEGAVINSKPELFIEEEK